MTTYQASTKSQYSSAKTKMTGNLMCMMYGKHDTEHDVMCISACTAFGCHTYKVQNSSKTIT